MPIRTKFAVLLGLLGAAVCIALAIAWWSLDVMQRESREPTRSMSSVLEYLGTTKRSIEDAASRLHDVPGAGSLQGVRTPASATQTPIDPQKLAQAGTDLEHAIGNLARISTDDTAMTRVGKRTFANLRSRLDDALAQVRSPEALAAPFRDSITKSLFEAHELIERAEAKIVGDTKQALAHGADVRNRLAVVLAIVLLLTLLAIGLSLSLIRRWIVLPVQELRAAAARFAAGDLSYRLAGPPGKDELAQLSTEFNHMAGMIQSLQNERVDRERLAAIGEMVRRLAHNLRNPLGGIRGLAELTRSELASHPASPLNPADLRENQDRIIATVDRFERWLTDLLSATRPAEVQPAGTKVLPWLQGLVEAHRASAETKGVGLSLDASAAPQEATFDPRHLEHALSALVSNAIEAAAAHKGDTPNRVHVSAREDGKSWRLRVQDSGPGIPQSLQERIFAPYFTTKRDGTGIGLALAAQVVRAHGGQLDLISPGNGDPALPGACFEVRLPLAGPDQASGETVDVARIGQSGASGGQDSRHRR